MTCDTDKDVQLKCNIHTEKCDGKLEDKNKKPNSVLKDRQRPKANDITDNFEAK